MGRDGVQGGLFTRVPLAGCAYGVHVIDSCPACSAQLYLYMHACTGTCMHRLVC